ncbi:hypothetical protein [Micromonospora deserti]|uniref:Uncharacterized protein n=1 Tax=Micromonospora deserti TaxID=2070366 RepID=A0A2W2CWD0_9ACTN|nr:hypothetical protein [Micromonospora deserti]PZF97614.1 hypothetical protein C1I99_15190 [Micromonospora deserti]
MSTFAEYAALARQLAEQRRAAEAERRRNLHATADYLQHRLTAQGQRLDQLGRATGLPPPATPPRPAPAPPVTPASGPPAGPAVAPPTGLASAPPVTPVSAPPAGLPSTSGTPPGSGVPAGVAAPAEVDPAMELELARRYADEADRHGQQAELLAQRPVLLPSWSSPARALAVYLAAVGVGVLLMLALLFGSGAGVIDLGTHYVWMCAGLPAVSLVAGWLVLGRWGRPAVVAGTPPRYPMLGVLVCFLLVPLTYCADLLALRVLR